MKKIVDKDAIRRLLNSKETSVTDVSKYVGISRNSIYKIIDGSSDLGKLQVDNAVKLTQYAYQHGDKNA